MLQSGAVVSARDVGNFAAGLVAGRAGYSWGQSRVAFDGLQSYQKRWPTIEGRPTQLAQRAGYNAGVRLQ